MQLEIKYKGRPLRQKYVADFVVYDKIIVEIKSIKQLGPVEQAQLLHYLKATGFRLGILLNFGNPNELEYKRFVN